MDGGSADRNTDFVFRGANRQGCFDALDIRRGRKVRCQELLKTLKIARYNLEKKVNFSIQHVAFPYFGQRCDVILEVL